MHDYTPLHTVIMWIAERLIDIFCCGVCCDALWCKEEEHKHEPLALSPPPPLDETMSPLEI